jgi:hypothetical protein
MEPKNNLSDAEPEDFEVHHFAECPALESGICDCDDQEKTLREDFAAMARECY